LDHRIALDGLSGRQQVLGEQWRLACKANVQGDLDDVLKASTFHRRERANVPRTHVDEGIGHIGLGGVGWHATLTHPNG